MKKNILFSITLLFTLLNIWGQESIAFETQKKTIPDDLSKETSKIIGSDDSGIYILKTRARSELNMMMSVITIEKYNHQLKRLKYNRLSFEEENKKDRKFIDLILLKGELVLFTKNYDHTIDKECLYVQTIDKEKLSVNGPPRRILENEPTYPFQLQPWGISYSLKGGFDIIFSNDSSKVAILIDLKNSGNENDKYAVKVFDNTINMIWEKEFTVDYIQGDFDLSSWTLDNDGNVYIAGLGENDKGKKDVFELNILFFSDNGAKIQKNVQEQKEKYLSDLNLKVDEEGSLIYYGFYSNEEDEDSDDIVGAYTLKFKKGTQEVVYEKYHPFSNDLIMSIYNNSEKSKAAKYIKRGTPLTLPNFKWREPILKKDGGVVLIAEQYYFYAKMGSAFPDMSSSSDQHFYHDILVISLDSNGEVEWMNVIPKFQLATTYKKIRYASYANVVLNDKLYFVFNDHYENIGRREDKDVIKIADRKDVTVVIVEIDQTGNLKTEFLSATKNELAAFPSISTQLNNDEFLFLGETKKDDCFVKLKIK